MSHEKTQTTYPKHLMITLQVNNAEEVARLQALMSQFTSAKIAELWGREEIQAAARRRKQGK